MTPWPHNRSQHRGWTWLAPLVGRQRCGGLASTAAPCPWAGAGQFSGRLARLTWLGSQDGRAHARLDRLLDSLKQQGAEDLGALLVGDWFERHELSAFP
ncbi:MAG: hypothetical protein ACO3B3_06945 [Cyanobium sp.]